MPTGPGPPEPRPDSAAALGGSSGAAGRPSSWSEGSALTPTSGAGAGSSFHGVPAIEGAPEPVRPTRPPRARFEAGELAMVCSHYDIGVIEAIKEFRRGSGRAPKVVLRTDRGRFLLKRRPAGADASTRVQFCHSIQLYLSKKLFPLPRLVRTRSDRKSMLVRDASIYELFEFVDGEPYDASLDATADAGRALALYHRLLTGFHLHGYSPPTGSFHAATGLEHHLRIASERLSGSAAQTIATLRAVYSEAAERVSACGFSAWPPLIIHGDWHPGNMLFRGSRVAAVIDYDTARLCPRAVDLANGALQFSITMRGSDPAAWPVGLDEGRFKRFLRGYETVPGSVVSRAELEALPWLMIEALVVEAVVPIAATGSFAGLSGDSFLSVVLANAAWVQQHARRLTGLIGE